MMPGETKRPSASTISAPAGIAVIPYALMHRVLQVRTLADAIHRLAKTGDLRAITIDRAAERTQPAFKATFARAQNLVREFLAQRMLPMRL